MANLPAPLRATTVKLNENEHWFFDFPATVRGRIYDNLLLSPVPLLLSTSQIQDEPTKVHRTNTGDSPMSSIILATNHQIHDEAAQVLYGKNKLVAQDDIAFGLFLARNGSYIHLIHAIKLDMVSPYGTFTVALDLLELATALESIEFCSVIRETYKPSAIAKKLAPVVKGVRKGYEETGSTKDALDIVIFLAGRYADPKVQSGETRKTNNYTKNVRMEIEKLLA